MTAEPPNPSGLCMCGCGETTPLSTQTAAKRSLVKGEHIRFVAGHQNRGRGVIHVDPPNPSGLCQCGCGQRTSIAPQNDRRRGWAKGEHVRFAATHGFRTPQAREARREASRRPGPSNWNWKGGRRAHSAGYVEVWVADDHPMAEMAFRRYVLEHRLVMAEHIGRPLRPEEVVHHKLEVEGGSGRKDDNRVENLRLFASKSEHVSHHRELERAA